MYGRDYFLSNNSSKNRSISFLSIPSYFMQFINSSSSISLAFFISIPIASTTVSYGILKGGSEGLSFKWAA